MLCQFPHLYVDVSVPLSHLFCFPSRSTPVLLFLQDRATAGSKDDSSSDEDEEEEEEEERPKKKVRNKQTKQQKKNCISNTWHRRPGWLIITHAVCPLLTFRFLLFLSSSLLFCSLRQVKSASGVDSLSSEWRDKFSASVSKILTGADLSQVSMGSVKKQIAAEHGELIVEAHGQAIKEMVIEAIKAQSTN